ncbi:ParB/RepB/Spo0J family partition protein [Kitasatospora sp. MBT63]|uniref:ParB/RepB/Spo0J family partition protein n=1 Tax=Kitasatospora sp. MBT63 TaxID=1444768 RepID=UPI00068D004B|nr:ParB/RepB/Spo0J family partition protein [Kitasatospora sp. MBT63]
MTVKTEARKTSTTRKTTATRKPTVATRVPVPTAPAAVEVEATAVEAAAAGKAVVALKLADVHRNEGQPREYFDTAALMELAASMAERGQLQPIIVRQDDSLGGYEIIMGERRWRAAHMNEAETIDAVIVDGPYTLRSFKDAVAENLNREDMTPLEEARAFQKILDEEEGATKETVAADFGKTTQFVNLRLKLLDLIPQVAEQVSKGAIGTQAAVQISQLTPANQQAVLAKWARGEFASENELVHFTFQVKQQQDQPFILALEDLTEEQRAERTAHKKATRTQLDQIERMITKLDEIGNMSLPDLVIALEGEIGSRMAQLDRVAKSVSKAMFQLRQAKAAAEAHTIAVNPDAVAPNLTGSPKGEDDAQTVGGDAPVAEESEAPAGPGNGQAEDAPAPTSAEDQPAGHEAGPVAATTDGQTA